jgi:hypothetical protein
MLDTVQIRRSVPRHQPNELIALGWSSSCGHAESDKFKLNLPKMPRLTWTHREDADWLTAEVSLPKFYFGNNVESLNDSQLQTALVDVGAYIEDKAQAAFDVPTAFVGRVDFCHNFKLESESEVKKYIRSFQQVRLPRYDTQAVNDSTVTLYAKSRQVCIYSKFDEVGQDKDLPKSLLASSKGILRIEPRYLKSSSVSALAKRLGTTRTVENLLRSDVSGTVMQSELKRIGADKPILSSVSLHRQLVELFGINKAVKYAGFLEMRNEQGEDFVKVHISKPTYQRIKKELSDAGLWLQAKDNALPSLKIEG